MSACPSPPYLDLVAAGKDVQDQPFITRVEARRGGRTGLGRPAARVANGQDVVGESGKWTRWIIDEWRPP